MESADTSVIKGYRFCATVQLRTPFRVLSRHLEECRKLKELNTSGYFAMFENDALPKIAKEQWEGIWMPFVFDGPPLGGMASDVGVIPATGGDYLPFLLAIRKIVESPDSIDSRIAKLHEMPIKPAWRAYLEHHGGMDSIANRFFPFFMAIGGKPMSPNQIAAMTDQDLLAIKGIGPAKLKTIRQKCANVLENRDDCRIDQVIR